MTEIIPKKMRAAALEQFGPPEVLHVELVPTPTPGPHEVLVQVDTAGVGAWDPHVRTGELNLGGSAGFPRILGNDGAGRVIATGKKVTKVSPGDEVYSYAWKGGFYAEYVALSEDEVAPAPPALSLAEAGALGADGITALLGLEDVLALKKGERVLVFGASGGVGHLAVQLALRMEALVFAVASGDDGVRLVRSLGVREVAEGHDPDEVDKLLRGFAPTGVDAALVLVGGDEANRVLKHVKRGGRVAHPNGVQPVPRAPEGVLVRAYDGVPSPEVFARLNHRIGSNAFRVELSTFPLEEAPAAHRAVANHHLGKVALRVRHLQ